MTNASGRLPFTRPGAWSGGFFEIEFELGEISDDAMRAAYLALWRYPLLDGCYSHRDVEPTSQMRHSPGISDDYLSIEFGLAKLREQLWWPCQSGVFRTEEVAWMQLYLPQSSLADELAVEGDPHHESHGLGWRVELDEWLVMLARHVHQSVPFRMAIIAFEQNRDITADEIAANGVPEDREEGYLLPRSDGLDYFPRNHH